MVPAGPRIRYGMCVLSYQAEETLRCSARFVRPFIEELAAGQPVGPAVYRELGLRSAEDRIPVQQAYELLNAAVAISADSQLGLKAAMRMDAGDVGVLDYLLGSAATVADAVDAAMRYLVLMNEAMECRLELDHGFATFRMDLRLGAPPAAEDFLLCSFYNTQAWLRRIPGVECCFSQPRPTELDSHERMFAGARCRFGAGFTGYVFARTFLQQPLEAADPKLHSVVREFADILLAQQANGHGGFADSVRAVLAHELATPDISAAWVARRLQVSSRTLARKLEAEGTSFYALLDDARKVRALRLVHDRRQPLVEIAQATGFAHVASFHRAFRRWTGKTPAEYRHTQETSH